MRLWWRSFRGPLPSCCGVAAVACTLTIACDSPASPGSSRQNQLLLVNAEGGIIDGRMTPDAISGEDIYRMNPDGTGRQNLTNLSTVQYPTFTLEVQYRSMALSPDGRTIAFESSRDGCPGIWGMNVDGSALRKLSIGEYQTTRCNFYPIWSPDGNHIAFTTTRDGSFSLYVMNADGSNPRNVALSLDDGLNSYSWPTGWTPDGRVVFQYDGETESQAYVVNADGTNLERLFGRTGDHSPEWSPDGTKVAFIRITASGSSLFVMNADGTDVRQLTNHPGQDVFWWGFYTNDYERWSPDGKRIVFTNVIDGGRADLHVIDADGTHDVQLTDYSADFNGWAPDGRITFNSAVSGSQELYLINPDGTGRVNLTNTPNSQELRGLWVRSEPGG
jgi:Tol biopolymer transport system component